MIGVVFLEIAIKVNLKLYKIVKDKDYPFSELNIKNFDLHSTLISGLQPPIAISLQYLLFNLLKKY